VRSQFEFIKLAQAGETEAHPNGTTRARFPVVKLVPRPF
jgi:hypothetical protein